MSAAKQKGTAWETAIVRYLIEQGAVHAERRVLYGAADRGDVSGIPSVVTSAKNCRRWDLAEWVNELAVMVLNAGAAIGAVWAKRPRKPSPADAYVILDGATYVKLLREAGYIPPRIDAGGQAGVGG